MYLTPISEDGLREQMLYSMIDVLTVYKSMVRRNHQNIPVVNDLEEKKKWNLRMCMVLSFALRAIRCLQVSYLGVSYLISYIRI